MRCPTSACQRGRSSMRWSTSGGENARRSCDCSVLDAEEGRMNASLRWAIVIAALVPDAAWSDAKAGAKKAALCELCHKPTHVMQTVPLLETQPARYLYARIRAFKEKRLPDPVMQTNVATLSDRDMRDIADYFAARPLPRGTIPVDDAKANAGNAKLA